MTDEPTAGKSIVSSAKEAAVIIFSILVAFSLDAWWEGVQVERDVDDILQAVESEMAENFSTLDSTISHHEAISKSILDLREIGGIVDVTREVFRTAVIEVEVFDASTGALDTLSATGLLGEIKDAELRLLLGSYGALLQDLNEQETRAVEFRDAARRQIASLGVRIWDVRDRESPLENVEMLNLLTMRAVEEGNSVISARALQDHIRDILSRLEKTP
jgi:hypothetical protein